MTREILAVYRFGFGRLLSLQQFRTEQMTNRIEPVVRLVVCQLVLACDSVAQQADRLVMMLG